MTAKKSTKVKTVYLLFLIRISLGFTLFWAFIDKVFGLGFATERTSAWLNGVSPTAGFLKFGTKGPFIDIFQSLAGNVFVDWLFMMGLLGIGTAFILGIAMRFAGYMGALLMALLYFSVMPPEHNPIIDEHIIYALLFLYLPSTEAGSIYGFEKLWRDTPIAKSLPFLK